MTLILFASNYQGPLSDLCSTSTVLIYRDDSSRDGGNAEEQGKEGQRTDESLSWCFTAQADS